MRLAIPFVLSLLAASPALAFDDPGHEQHLAPGQRAERIATPAGQARLNGSAAWQGLLAERGRWQAQWDEATGTPTRFWGEGIPVDGDKLADDDGAWQIGRALLSELAPLLGEVDLRDLTPLTLDRTDGVTTLAFARTWRGLPVHGARVSLRFRSDRLVVGQFESMPGIDRDLRSAAAVVPSADAREAALALLGWDEAETRAAPELGVYPVLHDASVRYHLAWRHDLRATDHVSRRHVWVDATTGEALASAEQIRFLQATLGAEIDDRYPQNGLTDSPVARVLAHVDGDDIRASMQGVLAVDGSYATVSYEPGSNHFRVRTADSTPVPTATFELGDGDFAVWTPDSGDSVTDRRMRAQWDLHVAAHVVRDRALDINPQFYWATQRVDANANSDEMECNAWFDGDINFVVQASGCNNTARVHDVVFHEYGHGFHAYSIINGVGDFDGALSEGLGDYMAATITGDPATARGFFTSNTNALRDIEVDRVWPDDVGEIHQTGRIIAGALWDTRKALEARYGAAGVELADKYFWYAAMRSTDIPSSYVEVLLADDDDGDLANGTPNQCLIDEQFGRHGLGPAGNDLGLFTIAHSVLPSLVPAGPVTVQGNVVLSRPACSQGDVSAVRVVWAHGDSQWQTLDVQPDSAGDFEAQIPAAPAGTEVRYSLEALDEAGDVAAVLPVGSVSDPWFATFTGEPAILFEATFEEDDGGFFSELLRGDPTVEGANDWHWGNPGGQAGDPVEAWSGDNVWGNDLSPLENWNGAYQPNIHSALRSPTIDVEGDWAGVYLQFRRWLNVEDGYWDQARVLVNGAEVWSQLASSDENAADRHHQDTHWALRNYDVTDLVSPDGTLEVRWEIISDGGLQMGGWTLDDVRILGLSGLPGADDDPDALAGAGCEGCSAGGSAALGLWLLPLVALGRRRRA